MLFALVTSCKVEDIVDAEDVYVGYTVVQAEIQPDKFFPPVRFTKTLPLSIAYDIKKSELKNVTAYIKRNGVQVIPLNYTVDGLYKPKYDFNVEQGETYELFAETEGKYIYAETIIPNRPDVNSTNYDRIDFYLEANINTKENEVYGAIWIAAGAFPAQSEDFYSISNSTYIPGTNIVVRTPALPEKYKIPGYSGNIFIQVYAFDSAFKDYFYSRSSGQEVNDPFIQNGGAISGNVKGDKVIGMFIGVTPGELINVY